jgi:hypothetical protein
MVVRTEIMEEVVSTGKLAKGVIKVLFSRLSAISFRGAAPLGIVPLQAVSTPPLNSRLDFSLAIGGFGRSCHHLAAVAGSRSHLCGLGQRKFYSTGPMTLPTMSRFVWCNKCRS